MLDVTLDRALGNLIRWMANVPREGAGTGRSWSPFQPKTFCGMVAIHALPGWRSLSNTTSGAHMKGVKTTGFFKQNFRTRSPYLCVHEHMGTHTHTHLLSILSFWQSVPNRKEVWCQVDAYTGSARSHKEENYSRRKESTP